MTEIQFPKAAELAAQICQLVCTGNVQFVQTRVRASEFSEALTLPDIIRLYVAAVNRQFPKRRQQLDSLQIMAADRLSTRKGECSDRGNLFLRQNAVPRNLSDPDFLPQSRVREIGLIQGDSARYNRHRRCRGQRGRSGRRNLDRRTLQNTVTVNLCFFGNSVIRRIFAEPKLPKLIISADVDPLKLFTVQIQQVA